MLGFHVLIVTASARFFVPALYPASERATDARLLPRVMPHGAPVPIAHSREERMLTTSKYIGLTAGMAVLGFGVTSARKAFRRKGTAAPRTHAPQMHGETAAERAKNSKLDAQPGEVAEVPFEIRLSLGNGVTLSGAVLFVFCIGKFLLNNGESDVVSILGFVYAIPALVGGLALKYAELPPVPFDTSPEAQAKRESLGTSIQQQIINDATRYTYGDAHMEGPLKALKLAPTGFGPPTLVKLAEAVTPQGQYSMTMRFHAPNTPYSVWKDRGNRYARFFAPDVRAVLKKYDKKRRLVELSLVTMATGESDEPLELLPDGSYARLNQSGWSNGGWVDDAMPAWEEDDEGATIAM
jgi:hypothetical protein